MEQLRQHPGIGLWFDNGYLVEQQQEPVQRASGRPSSAHRPSGGAGPCDRGGQA
ncbi:hypothetical protein [Xylella fastidiosa]|uniref:hypothetical protein n=1 Tax=Xylella fastidiosa TaxID=2371 RepID=UPI001F3DDC45|nr:hypothetical protein [Xylella fastidiosa]